MEAYFHTESGGTDDRPGDGVAEARWPRRSKCCRTPGTAPAARVLPGRLPAQHGLDPARGHPRPGRVRPLHAVLGHPRRHQHLHARSTTCGRRPSAWCSGSSSWSMLSVVNYRWFARWQIYIYGVTLAAARPHSRHRAGSETVGANRWIELPFFRLQTSELAKFLLILSLGASWPRGSSCGTASASSSSASLYVLVPGVLVFLQPDLGTALVFGAILVVDAGGVGHPAAPSGHSGRRGRRSRRSWCCGCCPAFGVHVLKDYQMQRLTVFLDPESDPTGAATSSPRARSPSAAACSPARAT